MQRILRTVGEATRVLLGRKPAGRGLTVFEDDVFIVSYPRSGNTWLRFLVGNLVRQNDPITFANLESQIPEIYMFPDRILRRLPRPRILKSHECFDPRYKRIIYVVRDPRDVAVSYYHYAIKRKKLADGYPIEEFVPRFLNAEFDVDWKWSASWSDHVMSWICLRRNHDGFLLLRYEDLLQEPEQTVSRIAAFLNLSASPERVARAIQLSSAEVMGSLEKSQGGTWKLTKDTRLDKPFIRSAKSGQWRTELPASSVAKIEAAWGALMRDMGYQVNEAATAQSLRA